MCILAQKTEVWTHWSEPSLAADQIKQEIIKDGVSSPRRKQNRETGYAEGALNLYEIKNEHSYVHFVKHMACIFVGSREAARPSTGGQKPN
jgi:hypothetical protein